jgi:pyrroline-5-carboxylate reductase
MRYVGIVGCGNLGSALIKGIREQYPELKIIASKRNLTRDQLKSTDENTIYTTDNDYLLANCEIIIIALKPYNMLEFLARFKGSIDSSKHTLVSVVTGIATNEMIQALEYDSLSMYRAMPNTAADVQHSMTAISGLPYDPLNRKQEIEELFKAVGEIVWIDEQLMESATILGACGIAYVLRFIRAMIQGGIEVGFDAKTANTIVNQTVKGAAQLLIQNGSHPEAEIDKVTTPKGVTIVGLNEMEHSGFSSALIKGIVTSYQKIEK